MHLGFTGHFCSALYSLIIEENTWPFFSMGREKRLVKDLSTNLQVLNHLINRVNILDTTCLSINHVQNFDPINSSSTQINFFNINTTKFTYLLNINLIYS